MAAPDEQRAGTSRCSAPPENAPGSAACSGGCGRPRKRGGGPVTRLHAAREARRGGTPPRVARRLTEAPNALFTCCSCTRYLDRCRRPGGGTGGTTDGDNGWARGHWCNRSSRIPAGFGRPARCRRARHHGVRPEVVAGPGAFNLGVMSGLHSPTEAVLWTRVDLENAPGATSVAWEVSDAPSFGSVVAAGTAAVSAAADGCVKVLAGSLEPDTSYWFRFRLDDETSPVGRARTVPAPDATPAPQRRVLLVPVLRRRVLRRLARHRHTGSRFRALPRRLHLRGSRHPAPAQGPRRVH